MADRNSVTLFVRNLPFTVTDADLEREFSAHGPVKSAFVVRQKGNSGNRGFGYVKFAVLEDAVKAHSAAVKVDGRLLQCSYAEKKARHKRRRDQEEESAGEDSDEDGVFSAVPAAKKLKRAAAKAKAASAVSTTGHQSSEDEDDGADMSNDREHPHADADSQAGKGHKPKSLRAAGQADVGRTVVVTGLPGTVTRDQIYKRFRKVGTVEETQYPVGESQAAHVRFATHKESRLAVTKLDKHIFKGATIYVCLLSKSGKISTDKNLKKSRLIVRNLSFKCSEDELKEAFSKYGEVVSVNIPLKPGTTDRRLGYAFVQFANVFQAAAAHSKINGQEIKSRPVAVDWVVPREEYLKTKEAAEAKSAAESGDESGAGEDGGDGESGEDGEESEDESEEDRGSDDEESEGDSDEEDYDDDDDSDSDGEGRKMKRKKKKPSGEKQKWEDDATEGRTLFVRNVSYDTEGEDLKESFGEFGEVRYARIVMDHDTGRSRGTAFVQFKDAAGATACMEAVNGKQGIIVDGREMNVTVAVTRDNSSQFKAKNVSEERRDKKDTRNLYLGKEGVIYADSDAGRAMSAADVSKRKKAEIEKKAKLANPNCFVSDTRLCVRNIPRSVSDDQLSKVFATCLGKGKGIRVKKARIMRDLKVLNAEGVARPRGFGFVEFTQHEDALEALRATNNNPEIFGKDKRLIVEFSIEDQRALHKQQLRLEKFQKGRSWAAEGTGGSGDQQPEEKTRKRLSRFDRKQKEKVSATTGTPGAEQASNPSSGVQSGEADSRTSLKSMRPVAGGARGKKEKAVKPPKTSRRNKENPEERNLDSMIEKHRRTLQVGDGRQKWFD